MANCTVQLLEIITAFFFGCPNLSDFYSNCARLVDPPGKHAGILDIAKVFGTWGSAVLESRPEMSEIIALVGSPAVLVRNV